LKNGRSPDVLDSIITTKALALITGQIRQAATDLALYQPNEVDWLGRSEHAASIIIPWLVKNGDSLKMHVEGVLNAPLQLRRLWSEIRGHVQLPKKQIEAFDHQLSLDDILRESVTGEVVSKIITNFLLERNTDFKSNGRSDYPDVYLGQLDYSQLPQFRRQRMDEGQEFGAALKGSSRRPVRVPDGLEIKTCRNSIRVDCHHPHLGLHLVLVFSEHKRTFKVVDLRIAFLARSDYHESNRNTSATTVKFSFNGERFISLLPSAD